MTGTWAEATLNKQSALQHELQLQELQQAQWQDYQVAKIVKESSLIKSFYLLPLSNGVQPLSKGLQSQANELQAQVKEAAQQKNGFEAGQFLTVKIRINGNDVIRTYTISSGPADPMLRISVKRETASDHLHPDGHLFEAEVHEGKLHQGKMSCYLHDHIQVGDKLQLKAPKGNFTLDAAASRPVVLLAGGVGITPMIAMTRDVMSSAAHPRHLRPLTIIAAARDAQQRAFFDEFNQLSARSNGDIRTFWALSQPESTLKLGQDYHHSGRINKAMLQAVLPIDDYDFYLCGPSGFMQSMYDLLRSLGISNARIKAEEFGPASLQRLHDQESTEFTPTPSASAAIIEFSKAKVEQAWSAGDGTLLEFAEDHGFSPEFGCRSGQCGACKTKLLAGKVSYQTDISVSLNDDEVLLCCALPAAVSGEEVVNIKLEL